MKEVDDFDDTERSVVYVRGETDTQAEISFWCGTRRARFGLGFGERIYVGDSSNLVQVRYRFDDSEVSERQWWRLILGGRGVIDNSVYVEDFILQARRANILRVEIVDPFDGNRVRYRFDLLGLAEATRLLPCIEQLIANR